MTLQDWYQVLEQDPEDWQTRLVFADWLVDHDQEVLARTQRWLVEHHRTPLLESVMLQQSHGLKNPLPLCKPDFWFWGRAANGSYTPRVGLSDLLFDLLRVHTPMSFSAPTQYRGPWWWGFQTLEQAEETLSRCLNSLVTELV